MPGGSIARMAVASGARYRSAIRVASCSDSVGSSGPSLRTLAAIGFSSAPPPTVAPGPTTTPIA